MENRAKERQRNELAKALFPIAYKQAKLVSAQSGCALIDLQSEAMFAIAMAMRNGNPEQPGFYSYVKQYVRGYLFNYLRDNSRVVKLPRDLSLAYLAEQRQLKINPDYREMLDTDKARLIGCSLDELMESRTAVSIGHQTLDFNDGDFAEPVCLTDSDSADLVAKVFAAGVSQIATQTRQDRALVESSFLTALRTVLEAAHGQS